MRNRDPEFEDSDNPSEERARTMSEAADDVAQSGISALDINSLVVGLSPALSIDQTLMAQAGAQGHLFASMVSDQQRQMTSGVAAALKLAGAFHRSDSSKDALLQAATTHKHSKAKAAARRFKRHKG